jgi:hypothetical protein
MPVRNAGWVINYSLRAALKWADAVCVLVHASKDDTASIVDRIRVETKRVNVIIEPDPVWNEAFFRQRLLAAGRRMGGTHFATVDADEILAAPLVLKVRGMIEHLEPEQLLELPWIDLWRGLDRYRADKCSTAPFAFGDGTQLRWRAAWDGYQLHMRNPWPTVWKGRQVDSRSGGMMHLQRAVWRRAEARQTLYKMNEALNWPNRRKGGIAAIEARHERSIDEQGAVMAEIPKEWWGHGLDRSMIDLEEEPWEVGEVRRLLVEHGRERFEGISLHGIDA